MSFLQISDKLFINLRDVFAVHARGDGEIMITMINNVKVSLQGRDISDVLESMRRSIAQPTFAEIVAGKLFVASGKVSKVEEITPSLTMISSSSGGRVELQMPPAEIVRKISDTPARTL